MLQSPTAHLLQLEHEINKVRRGFMSHLLYHLLWEMLKSKPIWHWLRVRLPEAVKGKGKLFKVTSSKIEFNPSDPTYVISQKPSIKGHRTFWRKSQGMSLAYPVFDWLWILFVHIHIRWSKKSHSLKYIVPVISLTLQKEIQSFIQLIDQLSQRYLLTGYDHLSDTSYVLDIN